VTRRQRLYRAMSSSMLRVAVSIYSKPGMREWFADDLAAMTGELVMRELPAIAEESGAHLVAAPKEVA